MGSAAEKITCTYAEYLVLEQKSETKHEWLNGEIFDMAGSTLEHAALALSVAAELRNALRDQPCRVFSSDLRVKILATHLCTYPDATVACRTTETAPDDPNALVNPTLIVEVLSDSSEAYDRGEKFAHYRRIPSLQEYVMISQKARRIEVYRRSEGGPWALYEAGPGESVRLESVGCSLVVDEIYRNPLA